MRKLPYFCFSKNFFFLFRLVCFGVLQIEFSIFALSYIPRPFSSCFVFFFLNFQIGSLLVLQAGLKLVIPEIFDYLYFFIIHRIQILKMHCILNICRFLTILSIAWLHSSASSLMPRSTLDKFFRLAELSS